MTPEMMVGRTMGIKVPRGGPLTKLVACAPGWACWTRPTAISMGTLERALTPKVRAGVLGSSAARPISAVKLAITADGGLGEGRRPKSMPGWAPAGEKKAMAAWQMH